MQGLGKLVIAGAAAYAAACSNDRDVALAPTTAVASLTPVRAPEVGLERYQRIVRNVADCKLEGYQIVPTCPGMHELAAGIAGVPVDVRAEVGRSLLSHPSPAVRVKAAELTSAPHGAGPSLASQDAIAEAASHERDPGVLRAFLRVIADHGATNPNVGKVLLAAADHADKDVRLQAVYALTSPPNRALAGGSTRVAQLAERDPELKVRTTACEYAGKLGTSDLLPLYTKLTADTSNAELYGACMEGLVRMFHDHPTLATANEQAYRLFLDRVEHQPRSETTPPWSVMSVFCYFSHGSDDAKLAAWKQRAPWFDAAAVKRVLTGVISDKATSWMARAAAIESMVGLGASKPELAALRTHLDPKDKPVLAKLASAISE